MRTLVIRSNEYFTIIRLIEDQDVRHHRAARRCVGASLLTR